MMKHPDAMSGFLVRGSANIDAMLAKGWTIVECDRNALLPHRTASAEPCRDAVADTFGPLDLSNPSSGVKVTEEELERMAELGPKPKRGRPRKTPNNP